MKKTASFTSIWPQVYQKIISPPPEISKDLTKYPKIKKLSPLLSRYPITKFKLDQILDPKGVGHVTTEDQDKDGKVDTIHLNSPRIEEVFKKSNIPLANFQTLDYRQLAHLLEVVSEVILHEIGHFGGQTHVQVDPDDIEKTFESEEKAEIFAKGEDLSVSIKKISYLKNKYENIFASRNKNPFGRNTKE